MEAILLTLILAQDFARAAQSPRELEKYLIDIRAAQQQDARDREKSVERVENHIDIAQEKVLPALQTIGAGITTLNENLAKVTEALETQEARSGLTLAKEVAGVVGDSTSTLVVLFIGAILGPQGIKRLVSLLLDLRKGAQ